MNGTTLLSSPGDGDDNLEGVLDSLVDEYARTSDRHIIASTNRARAHSGKH